MIRPGAPHPRRQPRAATLFGWLTGVFSLLLAGIVGLLVYDQTTLLDSVARLRTQTLPSSIEQQRLARNLETLRLEGEKVLAAPTPQARQQSLFVVSLMAGHPSILDNPHARDVATETELFLSRVARGSERTDGTQAEWEQLSRRLSLAADDITVDGVSLAQNEAAAMASVIEEARLKLFWALALTVVFVAVMLLLLHRHLVRPLQRIDTALKRLHEVPPALDLPAVSLREVRAIEAAIGRLHDVLQQHEETRGELEKLASTDMLTGLYNRRHFMTRAAGEVTRAQRYGRPVTVGLADLDHFKKINDEYGHDTGDLALKAFANLIRGTMRHADVAGRYGGEEFAFVFPETEPEEAAVLSNRLRSRLDMLVVPLADGGVLHMTLSIGLADASTIPLEVALSLADQALYEAKSSGRNTVAMAAGPGVSIVTMKGDDGRVKDGG